MKYISDIIQDKVTSCEDLTYYERQFLISFSKSSYGKYHNYKIMDLSKDIGFSTAVINRALKKIGFVSWSYFRPLITKDLKKWDYETDSFEQSFKKNLDTLIESNIDTINLLSSKMKNEDKEIILYAEGSSVYFANFFWRNLYKKGIQSLVMTGENNNDLLKKDKKYILIYITLSGRNISGYKVVKSISSYLTKKVDLYIISGTNLDLDNYTTLFSYKNSIHPPIFFNKNEIEREAPSSSGMFLIYYLTSFIDKM